VGGFLAETSGGVLRAGGLEQREGVSLSLFIFIFIFIFL
jgi:hypothetical protein